MLALYEGKNKTTLILSFGKLATATAPRRCRAADKAAEAHPLHHGVLSPMLPGGTVEEYSDAALVRMGQGNGSEMSTEPLVRPVVAHDYEQWRPLWDGYNAFYGRSGPTALSSEITRTTWSRFLDGYEPVYALVAEREGRLLGLTHYILHRSTIAIGSNCYLQDLFTSETARGKGVARALINGVYERAKTAGAARVYWLTHETNLAARHLYDKVAENSGFLVYRKLF